VSIFFRLFPMHLLQPVDVVSKPYSGILMCADYIDSIAKYLVVSQNNHRPSQLYLEERQTEVNQQMRSILIDWLNEVTEEFKLKAETFCLAVNFVDRYLSAITVKRNRLQLLGVVCLLIASKIHEIVPPSVDEFSYITDNTYTREEVIRMELTVLNELRYDVSVVTAKDFVGIYLKAAGADNVACVLADYLVELTLQEYTFLRWSPSIVAASAVVLALFTVESKCWSEELSRCVQHQPRELNECLQDIHRVFQNAPRNVLQAVREKYSHSRFLHVSAQTQAPPRPPAF
jgi:cyclin A